MNARYHLKAHSLLAPDDLALIQLPFNFHPQRYADLAVTLFVG